MISEDEYEALMETVHLLRSPANTTRLLQSIQEANKSELTEHELVEPTASVLSK
jgi:antitoxin YefM